MSTLVLTKNQKIDLTKDNAALKSLALAGGWDAGDNYDLDIFAIPLNAEKKVIESKIVYFNGKDACPGLSLDGDNLTGDGDGDDETITALLPAIPEEVQAVVLCINIFQAEERGQMFGKVQNSFVRMYNKETNEELARFDLNEDYSSNTGVIAGM